jgi:predicted nucleic acid-binding Zn ribbon protein
MSKTGYTQTKPLASVLESLIQGLGIQPKLHEYDAVLYWEDIVGEHIAKAATAIKITQGILYVQVSASTWRNELLLRKKEIIAKLNERLGSNTVKDIRLQ